MGADPDLRLTYEFLGCDEVRGRFEAIGDLRNRDGSVPVSLFTWLAESVAWAGTALLVVSRAGSPRSVHNRTSLLRPVTNGEIRVLARRRGLPASLVSWQVDCRDQLGQLCAQSTVLLTVDGNTRFGVTGRRADGN